MSFTDDAGNSEGPLTSEATFEVASATSDDQGDNQSGNQEDAGGEEDAWQGDPDDDNTDQDNTGQDDSPPEDITATITGLPTSHDGATKFTFELRFSPTPRLSYVTVRDLLFDVTNATIVKANRLNPPSNAGWLVHVSPAPDEIITLALPPTTDCDEPAAVCTAQGGKQTNGFLLMVLGP